MLRITAFDHVGIRVTDRARALAFYASLGFHPDPDVSNEQVAEVISADGVRLNLIFNGEPPPDGRNVLMDVRARWPGYTHVAFIVPNLQSILRWTEATGTRITEGPVDWGRRLTCFLRDPDGNVLEFNELRRVPGQAPQDPGTSAIPPALPAARP